MVCSTGIHLHDACSSSGSIKEKGITKGAIAMGYSVLCVFGDMPSYSG
jgi:hypothetical protein